MARFILTIEASVASAAGNAPVLDILVDGIAVTSSTAITALTGVGSDVLVFTLDYDDSSNPYPSSLSFRFPTTSGDAGDIVTLDRVTINGRDVTPSSPTITRGNSSNVNTAANDHLFGRLEPTQADLGAATQTGTGGNDEIVDNDGVTSIIDAGGGDDYVAARDNDDAINGGTGADTLFGQDGNDLIIGGAGNDRIWGNDGDDLLFGEGDNDRIFGEAGNDLLNGGSGDDILIGGAGNDVLYGEAGADRLIGVSGDNSMYGDDGNDTLLGGAGNEYMEGGADNDVIHAGEGNNEVRGGTGDDYITAGSGDDIIDGDAGNDEIYAGNGADLVDGGDDNDLINGGGGADELDGGDGADTIIGGDGVDAVNGGEGNDIIHGHGLDAFEISAILAANPNVSYSAATGSFYEFVNSSVAWNTARTNALGSTINGVAGHMVNVTSAGENQVVYQLGVDNGATNASGAGGNRIWLGGTDIVNDQEWRWVDGPEDGLQFSATSTATNNMYENWGTGQPNNSGGSQVYATIWFNGGGDADTWDDRNASDNHDYVIEWEGGLFSDDNAADILNGGGGDDRIYGWGGDDEINGGVGADLLFGGDGDDTINGAGITNDIDVFFASTANLTSYSGGQDGAGSLQIIENGDGFILDGNLWKRIIFNYTVTADTVLEFDFKSTVENEITSIGFETDDNFSNDSNRFKLYGTQAGSVNYAAPEATFDYDDSGDWLHYSIDVGTYFTGTFTHLAFIADDDGGGVDGNAWYRNIKVYDRASNSDDASNTLVGGAGDDTLIAGDQGDNLYGGADDDTLTGDAGDDTLSGDSGVDTVDGGGGNDTINLANGDFAAGESLTGNTGTDTIVLTNATTVDLSTGTIATVENLLGSSGDDDVTMTATQFGNFDDVNLAGGAGDVLNIIASGDISALGTITTSNIETTNLVGTAGTDTITLTGTQMNSILIGTATVNLGAGAGDTINLTSTSTGLNALGDGALLGVEEISGSGAAASITIDISAQTEDMTVTGSANADVITGGTGNDTLSGGAGNDTITSSSVDTIGSTITTILGASPEATYISFGWVVHTFTAIGNSTFNVHADVSEVYYLIVGGGGGGGGRHGGGGGGGGVVTNWDGDGTAHAVTGGGSYTITVGDGGTFSQTSPTNQSVGTNGGDSSFDGITGLGGGGGGSYTAFAPTGGGSGGGGGGVGPTTAGSGDGRDENRSPGAANQTDSADGTGYGNAGGVGSGPGATPSNTGGGGGGGAGAAGSAASGTDGGDGGDGMQSNISGTDTYYAGGGGGGSGSANLATGGLGGAGDGGINGNSGSDGVDGTGGGGGGTRSDGPGGSTASTGADGGSGIVIIRYQMTPMNSTTIVGGAGNDDLYGGAGQDIFVFDAASVGFSDTIYSYDTDHMDTLDISDLLTGFTAGVSDANDFANLAISGADLLLQVDANGTTGGTSFTTIATLDGLGASGLTIDALYDNGALIMS